MVFTFIKLSDSLAWVALMVPYGCMIFSADMGPGGTATPAHIHLNSSPLSSPPVWDERASPVCLVRPLTDPPDPGQLWGQDPL